MFIDETTIRVKAGNGGNGCMAFRREKFVPRGGPSGGDGGKGGDVWMESSERHNTLVHFRFNPEYKAGRGRHGEGSNKTGREGEDILLKVPVGTIVYDEETGDIVHDFSRPDERVIIAAADEVAAATPSSPLPPTRRRASTKRVAPARKGHFASSETARRCRPGRISQCRQVNLDLAHLGRPS